MRVRNTPALPDITAQCGTQAPNTRVEELLYKMLQRSQREVVRLQKIITEQQKNLQRFYSRGIARHIAKKFVIAHNETPKAAR
jgi:hypothetical protein